MFANKKGATDQELGARNEECGTYQVDKEITHTPTELPYIRYEKQRRR